MQGGKAARVYRGNGGGGENRGVRELQGGQRVGGGGGGGGRGRGGGGGGGGEERESEREKTSLGINDQTHTG